VGRGFLPAPGPVVVFDPPSGPGVRVDSGVAAGSVVPPAFDSLMAKLIVTGATRGQALARARRALAEFRIEGLPSVLPFHREVLRHSDFTASSGFRVHTRWIETDFAADLAAATRGEPVATEPLQHMTIEVDGRRMRLGLPVQWLRGLTAAAADGASGQASASGPGTETAAIEEAIVTAPMSGLLQGWKVEEGADVTAGQLVAVLEAMKMETQVVAHRAGRLSRLADAGAQVASGAALARID